MSKMNEQEPEPTNAEPNRNKSKAAIAAYWFQLIAQPVMGIVFLLSLAYLFGYAQRNFNWFNSATSVAESDTDDGSVYACSMLCTFLTAPGRCPVCGMELQEVEVSGDPKDVFGVAISPAARRLADIKTVAALNIPMSKEIEVLGKVVCDETTETTIAAYVDGRIEQLLVDFTGAKVSKGDALAVLYSPQLFADQSGLLSAKRAYDQSRSSNKTNGNSADQRLYESARRRLIEFGIPEQTIDEIERRGKPERHVKIYSPVSGTIIEKCVDEGDDVLTRKPLFKVADFSKVWLMLEMFPEDTANLKIGQPVEFVLQSHIGQKFAGKISFIDPALNPKSNTVSVRVEVPNDAGVIKIGDFGNARIQTTQDPDTKFVVVPRQAVLINGADSVAYVETEPGRFEYRNVEVADIMGDKISLSSGIKPGEMVVAKGVFMLDSTFNIQGKVSLIDPNRAARKIEAPMVNAERSEEIEKALSELNAQDRILAESQIICPVSQVKLGSAGMGVPIRIDLNGTSVMICCEGCRTGLLNEPEKCLKVLTEYHDGPEASMRRTTAPFLSNEWQGPELEFPEAEFPTTELSN